MIMKTDIVQSLSSKFEVIQRCLDDWERLQARKILTLSEKGLFELIYERTGSDRDFGIIRNKGDKALFDKTTQQMIDAFRLPKNRVLADFLPTNTIKAKDFVTEITVYNTKERKLRKTHNS